MKMLKILVNAYSVSPNRGSEPGMGWNWCVRMARECELFIITEEEFREEIETVLPTIPQAGNMHFHFLPVSDRVRRMCWNQGDWRFYFHYARWQKRALVLAKDICARNHIDIIHQLNMVGFREPGYLWIIKGPKFVWGPIGGMSLIPVRYFDGISLWQKLRFYIRNFVTRIQRKWAPRVVNAINHSSFVICATPSEYDVVSDYFHKPAYWISETGTDTESFARPFEYAPHSPLRLVWVGRFIPSKQLEIALKVMHSLRDCEVTLDVVGSGSPKEIARYRALADELELGDRVRWRGQVAHDDVFSIMMGSDLFFFTSVYEATSTVMMEAISVGLPVVCFDTCGFGPLVNDNIGIKIPLTAPEDSVVRFSEVLRQILANPSMLSVMSSNAQVRSKDLTWDEKTRKLSGLYNEISNA